MTSEQQQLKKIFKFASRNLRLILILLLCVTAAGLALYLQSPKVYQATALIMYQQQQINPTRLSPDVETELQEMVNTVGQQVASRANLEDIILSHNLYPDMRKQLPMEDVVVAMRRQITFEPQRRANIFQVSFSGDSPGQISRVANTLASKFIEENIRFREQRVTETSAYIKDELAIAKAALDEQEKGMRDYKLRYYNEMPAQRDANIARLNTLQTQDQSIQNNLQDLKRTKLLVQEQISLRKDILTRFSEGKIEALGDSQGLSEPARLRQELETLRSRYTDSHPDVKRLQNRLQKLLETENQEGNTPEQAIPPSAAQGPLDSQLAQLELQLKEIDISVARLLREQEVVRQQMERLQGWVEAAPVREAEWAALTRDYGQLQQHYEDLVTRNLEAESAELLERRQRGSQFKIIEPALPPSKPFKPNFRKIMLLAVALGLGLGVGLSYAQEFMDSSFKDINDLEEYLGLPVTCALPLLPTAREKKAQRLRTIGWTIVLTVGFLTLLVGIVILWLKGIIVF